MDKSSAYWLEKITWALTDIRAALEGLAAAEARKNPPEPEPTLRYYGCMEPRPCPETCSHYRTMREGRSCAVRTEIQ